MARLSVSNFSCVEKAELDLAKLTVLIGPQASGKSVISKLVYFFNDIPRQQYKFLGALESLDSFKKSLIESFIKWFPPSAWGASSFIITFTADPFFAKVTRTDRTRDEIRINLAPAFETKYNEFKELLSRERKKDSTAAEWEEFSGLQRTFERRRQEEWGENFIPYQLFIPAGRSFFTTIGKAISTFEYGGIDPLTSQFGKLFALMRERRQRKIILRRVGASRQQARDKMMREFFGGKINFGDDEYVEADDGRRIPFSLLSSGQQELLPLWLAIEYVQESAPRSMVYIEEPEAHLFPTAQSQLLEFLAGVISAGTSRMLITTHSPYVLSQLNVLLKAGMIAESSPELRARVDRVVKQSAWIKPGTLAAYAIVQKQLTPIHDESGLIDGDYLDEVSNHLAREFNSLLEIEATNDT